MATIDAPPLRAHPRREGVALSGAPVVVAVERLPVELGAFLKLAHVVASGGEGKRAVQDGSVWVNGACEQRRRRMLRAGDIVTAGGRSYRVGAVP